VRGSLGVGRSCRKKSVGGRTCRGRTRRKRTVFEPFNTLLQHDLQPLRPCTDESADKPRVDRDEAVLRRRPRNRKNRFDKRGVTLIQLRNDGCKSVEPCSELNKGSGGGVGVGSGGGWGEGGLFCWCRCGWRKRGRSGGREEGAKLRDYLIVAEVVALPHHKERQSPPEDEEEEEEKELDEPATAATTRPERTSRTSLSDIRQFPLPGPSPCPSHRVRPPQEPQRRPSSVPSSF
jgi:hypothetical protein